MKREAKLRFTGSQIELFESIKAETPEQQIESMKLLDMLGLYDKYLEYLGFNLPSDEERNFLSEVDSLQTYYRGKDRGEIFRRIEEIEKRLDLIEENLDKLNKNNIDQQFEQVAIYDYIGRTR